MASTSINKKKNILYLCKLKLSFNFCSLTPPVCVCARKLSKGDWNLSHYSAKFRLKFMPSCKRFSVKINMMITCDVPSSEVYSSNLKAILPCRLVNFSPKMWIRTLTLKVRMGVEFPDFYVHSTKAKNTNYEMSFTAIRFTSELTLN